MQISSKTRSPKMIQVRRKFIAEKDVKDASAREATQVADFKKSRRSK